LECDDAAAFNHRRGRNQTKRRQAGAIQKATHPWWIALSEHDILSSSCSVASLSAVCGSPATAVPVL
jgi:hypothetical protein